MYRAIISGARAIVPHTAFDSGAQHIPLSFPFETSMADRHLPRGAPFSTDRSAVPSNELFSPWEMQGGKRHNVDLLTRLTQQSLPPGGLHCLPATLQTSPMDSPVTGSARLPALQERTPGQEEEQV